ncbi:hypothetical protein VPH35_079032 [Triticum aestivum]
MEVDDCVDPTSELLQFLQFSNSSYYKGKLFFLESWYGWGVGASALLRATAKSLKSRRCDPSTREHFGKIIHSYAKGNHGGVNLDHLMPMFDKQDEDDDFSGIDSSSRVEIPSIESETNANERFLMIFQYGGEELIDLAEFGIPEFGAYALGKLLWSSYVRFQLSPRGNKLKFNSGYVIVIRLYLKGLSTVSPLLCRSLREEAAELVGYTGMDGINPTIVLNCFLYSLFLTEKQRGKPISVDYAWDTHACNYWICDGILQGDKAYEVGSALHAVMQMLCYPSDRIKVLVDYFGQHGEQYERWVSISSNQSRDQNISIVPVNASSYFLTVAGDNQLQLPNDMFQLAMNLHVLKLHKCSFDFASPPFRFRHNLRFLWLDHCTNSRGDQGGWQCFPNLLVLDIRFTDFVLLIEMTELMTNLREVNTKGISWRNLSHAWKKLYNLHKLRVTESLDVITVETCSFVDMINLELLDLSVTFI